jgi:hypothetical protein
MGAWKAILYLSRLFVDGSFPEDDLTGTFWAGEDI